MYIINQSHYWRHLAMFVLIFGQFATIYVRAQENAVNNQLVTDSKSLTDCFKREILNGEGNLTVADIRKRCSKMSTAEPTQKLASEHDVQTTNAATTPLETRIQNERSTAQNPNVITPHKPNYFLPISYVSEPNAKPYESLAQNSVSDNLLDNYEAKFQISFKAPILASLLKKDDALFFGFTLQSWWQMYNSEVSSPFRETNYQPEVFYALLNDFNVGSWKNRVVLVGIEHQSNGRSQPLSRSWNRVYANFIWENNRWITSFKPWYRIPEKSKSDPFQADGDDNPDIERFMGSFELTTVYKFNNQTLGLMLRNNLRSDNKGAIQLDWTFSLGKRFRGYAQYFNGYGESLIDYDQSVQRIGVGISLTDIF